MQLKEAASSFFLSFFAFLSSFFLPVFPFSFLSLSFFSLLLLLSLFQWALFFREPAWLKYFYLCSPLIFFFFKKNKMMWGTCDFYNAQTSFSSCEFLFRFETGFPRGDTRVGYSRKDFNFLPGMILSYQSLVVFCEHPSAFMPRTELRYLLNPLFQCHFWCTLCVFSHNGCFSAN